MSNEGDINVELCSSLIANICTSYDAIKSVPDNKEYDNLSEAIHEAKIYLIKSFPDKYHI